MNEHLFNKLSFTTQCDLLWEEGQFIQVVSANIPTTSLYAIRDFFVEVFYRDNTTTITKIEIASWDCLHKCLPTIDIDGLFRRI